MQAQLILIHAKNERLQCPPDQSITVDLEQRGRREIGLDDATLAVESQVADRGAVVEVGVALDGALEPHLSRAQLIALYLELDPVDAQLVHELSDVSRHARVDRDVFQPKALLSLAARIRSGRRLAAGRLGSHISPRLGVAPWRARIR